MDVELAVVLVLDGLLACWRGRRLRRWVVDGATMPPAV